MKKNIMMRLASGLLVAVLLTTCAISGTFAKYVTADKATDSARVAKWGVVVSGNGQLFDTKYATNGTVEDADGNPITFSVESNAEVGGNLVAPGTKNTENMTFGVTGKPEVAVNVKISVDKDSLKDVVLKAGTYNDPTNLVPAEKLTNGNFTFEEDYHPLKFTLTNTKSEAEPVVTNGTLDDIVAALESDKNYAPNTDLATVIGSYTLTWEWAFENKTGDPAIADPITDAMDTTLGNMAATPALIPAGDNTTSTEVALDLSIVVTQID